MIYTIGHAINYRKAFRENPTVKKVGKREPCENFPDGYLGGYAFHTYEDAQRRIDEAYPDRGFIVFGLNAEWEHDTYPSPDGWWHYLIRDAPIIDLVV